MATPKFPEVSLKLWAIFAINVTSLKMVQDKSEAPSLNL